MAKFLSGYMMLVIASFITNNFQTHTIGHPFLRANSLVTLLKSGIKDSIYKVFTTFGNLKQNS